MKINIYYGGRGVIGDPSLFAIKKSTLVKSQQVGFMEELLKKVQKYISLVLTVNPEYNK